MQPAVLEFVSSSLLSAGPEHEFRRDTGSFALLASGPAGHPMRAKQAGGGEGHGYYWWV